MSALLCFYDYGRVFAFLGRTLAATLERRRGAVLKTCSETLNHRQLKGAEKIPADRRKKTPLLIFGTAGMRTEESTCLPNVKIMVGVGLDELVVV